MTWKNPSPCPYDFPGNLTSPFPYNICVSGEMLWDYWRLDDASLPLACIKATDPTTFFNITLPVPGWDNLAYPALYGFATGMGVMWFDYNYSAAGAAAHSVWNGSSYTEVTGTEQLFSFTVPTAPTDATHQISVVLEWFLGGVLAVNSNLGGTRVRLYSPSGATLIDQTYRSDAPAGSSPVTLTYSNGAATTGTYKLGLQAVWINFPANQSCTVGSPVASGHVTFATGATVDSPSIQFNQTGALVPAGDADHAIAFNASSTAVGTYLSTGHINGGTQVPPQATPIVTAGFIKTTMAPAKTALWSIGTSNGRRSMLGVRLDPASAKHLYVYTTNADSGSAQAGDDFLCNTGVTLNDGNYHWIVAMVNYSPNWTGYPSPPLYAVIVYVDGVRVGSQDFTTLNGNTQNLYNPGIYYLGCDAASKASPTYIGTFDEVCAIAFIQGWNDAFVAARWAEATNPVAQINTGPTSYDQLIMAQVPYAYWTLGDCSLPTLTDSSGNGHDMTWQLNYGSPAAPEPYFRYPGAAIGDRRCGMYFGSETGGVPDGTSAITNQLYEVNQDFSAVGHNFTITMLIKCLPNSAPAINTQGFCWAFKCGPIPVSYIGLFAPDSSNVYCRWGVSGGGTSENFPSYSINDGQWHHIAISNDPSGSGKIYTYFDGKLVATDAADGTNLMSSGHVTIGGEDNGAASHPFLGGVANVAVFARVLTPAEILDEYYAAFGQGATSGAFPDNQTSTRVYLAQVQRTDELGHCRWININVTKSQGKYGKKKSAEFTLDVVDDGTPTALLYEGEKVRIYRGVVGEPLVRVFTGYVDMKIGKRTSKDGQLIRTYTCTDNRKEIKDAIMLEGKVFDGMRPNDACNWILQKAIDTGQYLTVDDNCISQSNITASDPYAYANPSASPVCYFPDLFNDDGSVYFLPEGSTAWVPDLYLQPGGPTTKASLYVPAIASGTNPQYLTFELPKALIIASTFSMTGWNVIDYVASGAVPPPVGTVSVDWFNGVLYFNTADTGKLVYLAYAYWEKPLFDFPLGHSCGDAIDEIWTKTGLEFLCDSMGKLQAVYTDIFRAPKRFYGDSQMVNEVSMQIDRDRRNVVLCMGFDPTGSQILGAKAVNQEDWVNGPPKGLGKRAYMIIEDKSWMTQAAVNRAAFYCIQQTSRRAKHATYQVQGDPYLQLEDVVSFRDAMTEIDPNDFFYVESIDMNDMVSQGKVESIDQITGTSLPGRGYFVMTQTLGALASGQYNYLQEVAVCSLSNGSTGTPGNMLCLVKNGVTLQAGGNYYSQVSISHDTLSLIFTPVHSGGIWKLGITGSDGYQRLNQNVAIPGKNTITIQITNWTVGAIYVFKLTYIDPVTGAQAIYRDYIRAVA